MNQYNKTETLTEILKECKEVFDDKNCPSDLINTQNILTFLMKFWHIENTDKSRYKIRLAKEMIKLDIEKQQSKQMVLRDGSFKEQLKKGVQEFNTLPKWLKELDE